MKGKGNTMGWLVGYTLASMVAAFVIVRIFDYLVSGAVGGLAHAARTSLFVSAWTAVTTGLGMRDFTKRVRQLRQANARWIARIGKRH